MDTMPSQYFRSQDEDRDGLRRLGVCRAVYECITGCGSEEANLAAFLLDGRADLLDAYVLLGDIGGSALPGTLLSRLCTVDAVAESLAIPEGNISPDTFLPSCAVASGFAIPTDTLFSRREQFKLLQLSL